MESHTVFCLLCVFFSLYHLHTQNEIIYTTDWINALQVGDKHVQWRLSSTEKKRNNTETTTSRSEIRDEYEVEEETVKKKNKNKDVQ